MSLFCYPQAPLMALLEAWAAGSQPIRVISFDGTPGAQALRAFGAGAGRRRGALAGEILPFLAQDDYDRVLWACDWNFVRGEDSFVRAQLAGRPLVWQAYPQAGNAHAIKLQAFLDRYSGSGNLIVLPRHAMAIVERTHACPGLAGRLGRMPGKSGQARNRGRPMAGTSRSTR